MLETCSSRQIDCSVDNHAKNFPVEIQVCFINFQKWWEKIVQFFSLKFLPLYTLKNVLTPLPVFLSKAMRNSGDVPKKSQKNSWLLTYFSQIVDLDSWNALLQPCQKFYAKNTIFPLKDGKRSTNSPSVLENS